jgi:hypothetical protein
MENSRMAQIEINSLFSNAGIPATDIANTTAGYPKVRIWEVNGSVQTLIVGAPSGTGQSTDGVMTEIATGSPEIKDGFYTFLFTDTIGYDPTKKYLIRSDGGPSLPNQDRYQTAEINPFEETIIDGVWNEDRTEHLSANSFGLAVNQVKADTTQLFLDISAVQNIVDLILKFDTNRTKIDETNKTLTVFDDDCVTPLRVFHLFDQFGNLSTDSVCERKPTSASDGQSVCSGSP